MRVDAPCKDCIDRYFGCHGECDGYKAWQAERMKEKALAAKEQRIDSYEHKRALRCKDWKRRVEHKS